MDKSESVSLSFLRVDTDELERLINRLGVHRAEMASAQRRNDTAGWTIALASWDLAQHALRNWYLACLQGR